MMYKCDECDRRVEVFSKEFTEWPCAVCGGDMEKE